PGERGSEVIADAVSRDLGRNCELGLACRGLRLNVRLGRPGGLVDLGPQAASPFVASPSDSPVVIRSTAICRSSSDAGCSATTRPRESTMIRSPTWKTESMVGE